MEQKARSGKTHQQIPYFTKIEDILEHKERYNIVNPLQWIREMSPLLRAVPEVIGISSDPQDGHVFRVKASRNQAGKWADEYSLTTTALEKIAQAAGVVFCPTNTKRTDDRKNPKLVEFQATGALRKPDGTWITMTQTKELDLDAIEREMRIALEQEARDGKLVDGVGSRRVIYKLESPECSEEIDRRVGAKMVQLEKDKVAIAETGAHNRVIRALLALKPSYKKDELQKPFVVFRVSLNTEYILVDPQLKRDFLYLSFSHEAGPFGLWASKMMSVTDFCKVLSVVRDSPAGGNGDQNLSKERESKSFPSEEVTKGNSHQPPQIDESAYRSDWVARSADERLAEINRLISVTQYSPKSTGKAPEALSPQQQVDYLWFLYNLPRP